MNTISFVRRHWRLAAPVVSLLAVAAVAGLLWVRSAPQATEASTVGTTEMSLTVASGAGDCGPGDKPAKCTVPVDTSFVLSVNVNSYEFPYTGIQTQIEFGSLVYKPAAVADEITWPDADILARSPGTASSIEHGATSFDLAESNHKGEIVRITLTCPATDSSHKISLVPYDETNVLGSGLLDSSGVLHPGSDSLTVNCATPTPTPVPTDTPTPAPEQEINIPNLGQYALPKSCFDVHDPSQTPLFTVCDNNFQGSLAPHISCNPDGTPECEDSDPAEGSIRVAVAPDTYHVTLSQVPDNHTADPAKLVCDAVSTKCDLSFTSAPGTRPWFPWDINNDGVVNLPDDIMGVARHFGETKPTPASP